MSYAAKSGPAGYPVAQDQSNPIGVVSLVLGIVSIFSGCPFSVAAIITGWIGMKREPSGMARAGFIMGLIMTAIQVVALLFVGVIFLLFGGMFGLAILASESERAPSAPYAPSPPWVDSASESAYPAIPIDSPNFAPGMYPGGGAMPPYIPPGATPPSFPPPYIPGAEFGPGGLPPGAMPMPPGATPMPLGMPPGMVGPGGLPVGAYPPGAFPPGAFPPGTPSNDAVPGQLGEGPIDLEEEAPLDDAEIDAADAEANDDSN